jgi:hypothetical protein
MAALEMTSGRHGHCCEWPCLASMPTPSRGHGAQKQGSFELQMSIVRQLAGVMTLFTVLAGAASAQTITLGQIDNFENLGLNGWGASSVTSTNIADAGPSGAGDNALQVAFARMFVFHNSAQWTGNYIAAGVGRISMDVQHQNAFPLQLRLGIAKGVFGSEGTGDTYVTNYSIAVPNDNQWHHITFDASPADFIATSGNPGPSNPTAALMGVTHLRILHNPVAGDFRGAFAPGMMRVDNILAEGPGVIEDADFDDDGDVDGQDFLVWQQGLGVGTTNPTGDADASGSVDGLDLAIWKTQFSGAPAQPAAAVIPEPAAPVLGLVAAGIAIAAALWRRDRLPSNCQTTLVN